MNSDRYSFTISNTDSDRNIHGKCELMAPLSVCEKELWNIDCKIWSGEGDGAVERKHTKDR